MAYTPSPRKSKAVINNFAGQPIDANRVVMSYANSMESQDNTASPVTSPQTNMSASGVTLTVPDGAVRLVLNSTVTIQIGEDGSYAQGLNVPANTLFSVDCAQQKFIYLKPSNGTNTVSFLFVIV